MANKRTVRVIMVVETTLELPALQTMATRLGHEAGDACGGRVACWIDDVASPDEAKIWQNAAQAVSKGKPQGPPS